ncbi:MAG: AAA family ATPase, partial [Maioricimonas sp. JB049]
MATAAQVKALLKSYSDDDREHFVSVALQIAAHAARTGKGKLARELRDLVDDIKRRPSAGPAGATVPLAQPPAELSGLLRVSYPQTRLPEMVLDDSTHAPLIRTIREYRQVDRLREHGFSPRRKLLLIGPPGCGKTMTAFALAGELRLPLFCVQFHGLL